MRGLVARVYRVTGQKRGSCRGPWVMLKKGIGTRGTSVWGLAPSLNTVPTAAPPTARTRAPSTTTTSCGHQPPPITAASHQTVLAVTHHCCHCPTPTATKSQRLPLPTTNSHCQPTTASTLPNHPMPAINPLCQPPTANNQPPLPHHQLPPQKPGPPWGFFFGSDLGKLAKPSYQTVLHRVLGITNMSSPVLRLSHSSVW